LAPRDQLEKAVATLPGDRCQRPEIQGEGFCFGLQKDRKQNYTFVVHSHTYDFRDTFDAAIIFAIKEFEPCDFPFTPIQVLRLREDESAPPHFDKNGENNITVSLGTVSGGRPFICGTEHDPSHKPLLYSCQ
jgi:hypothetical protein